MISSDDNCLNREFVLKTATDKIGTACETHSNAKSCKTVDFPIEMFVLNRILRIPFLTKSELFACHQSLCDKLRYLLSSSEEKNNTTSMVLYLLRKFWSFAQKNIEKKLMHDNEMMCCFAKRVKWVGWRFHELTCLRSMYWRFRMRSLVSLMRSVRWTT